MDSATRAPDRQKLFAYGIPMVVFLALLGLVSLFKRPGPSVWMSAPELWIFPLQTLICAGLLWHYWRHYEFHRLARVGLVVGIATLVFVLWISPQAFFGRDPRLEGFNPDLVAHSPVAYWASVFLRFARLVIVVPLVEEIFWRGFLLRYLINDQFERVSFGSFSWLSFGVVTAFFTLSHSMPDWPAAAITGALYNFVAYKTRSLLSCVLAHAITNLLLGFWIMQTKQWGFW